MAQWLSLYIRFTPVQTQSPLPWYYSLLHEIIHVLFSNCPSFSGVIVAALRMIVKPWWRLTAVAPPRPRDHIAFLVSTFKTCLPCTGHGLVLTRLKKLFGVKFWTNTRGNDKFLPLPNTIQLQLGVHLALLSPRQNWWVMAALSFGSAGILFPTERKIAPSSYGKTLCTPWHPPLQAL